MERKRPYEGDDFSRPYHQEKAHRAAVPSKIVILRHLNAFVKEVEIETLLTSLQFRFIYTRVVKDKQTGQSKGYAFVKFRSIDEVLIFTTPLILRHSSLSTVTRKPLLS